jgi:hypothetical protein
MNEYHGYRIEPLADEADPIENPPVDVTTPEGERWNFNSEAEAIAYIDGEIEPGEDRDDYAAEHRLRSWQLI